MAGGAGVMLASVLAAGVALGAPPVGSERTLLVSRGQGLLGPKGNGNSLGPAISGDGGFVVFSSLATNLGIDSDAPVAVVGRDVARGANELVGESDTSASIAVSSNGRFVAFVSGPMNPDTDLVLDVYLRDRKPNTTTLVSRASGAAGAKGDAGSFNPDVSANGRFVVFTSSADNLDPDDPDGRTDIFVRDLSQKRTLLVSRATGRHGAHANGFSGGPSISDDGQTIAFSSEATTNLDRADTDMASDVYVRRMARPPQRPTTRLVSRGDGANGQKFALHSVVPQLSADGRVVAFRSRAPFEAADTNPGYDIYARDLGRNQTTLVSRAAGAAGAVANGDSLVPSSSTSGRFIAFSSTATNLHPDDAEVGEDVYVRDIARNTIELASRADGCSGAKANGVSRDAAISGNGRVVAFDSQATNLNPDDTNVEVDVYIRGLAGPRQRPC